MAQKTERPFSTGPENGFDAREDRPATRAALKEWLALQAALCLSPVRAIECIEAAAGDPAVALKLSRQSARPSAAELEAWVGLLAEQEIRVLPVTSLAYPMSLRVISDPPAVLFLRGQLPDWQKPAVAIVGARAATRYGLDIANELARNLSAAGIVVVSGLARGIDAAAHRGALEAGSTWAVLGCGPDRVYPREHRELARNIVAAGTVLTELPLGRPPAAPHFPLRNRIISGLVKAVVVVEARLRSGSLITARHALTQGREVMVVPGAINSPTSAGTNALLRDGARPVLGVEDIFEALGEFDPSDKTTPSSIAQVDTPLPEDDQSIRILHALHHESLDRDSLQRTLGLSSRELSLRLVQLELTGWISSDRDGRLCLARARAMVAQSTMGRGES